MTGMCASGNGLMHTHEANVLIAKSSFPGSFSKVTEIVRL